MLKNLKNRYMWAGEKIHDCINHTLTNLQRGISVLDVDQIVDITLNQMREEFRSSREKRYHTHPKTCALFEHEYEKQVSNDDWKKTADNMELCLRNFYSSETFEMLKELPKRMWLEVEDFSSFKLSRSDRNLVCFRMPSRVSKERAACMCQEPIAYSHNYGAEDYLRFHKIIKQ